MVKIVRFGEVVTEVKVGFTVCEAGEDTFCAKGECGGEVSVEKK